MKKILYPGSFDPITKGHMNVIQQATELFDEVIIAIMKNPTKKSGYFTPEERLELIQKLYQKNKKVKAIIGSGASTDIAISQECKALLRGLRGVTDFDYELQLADVNRQISNKEVTTLCLFPDSGYQYISSSVVKEVFSLGKKIDSYVEPAVEEAMIKKLEYQQMNYYTTLATQETEDINRLVKGLNKKNN